MISKRETSYKYLIMLPRSHSYAK